MPQEAHAEVPAASVHQRYQKSLSNASVDSISFPVSNPKSVADLVRPLWNAPIRLNAVIVGISGLDPLSTPSEMLFCSNFRKFPHPDIPINCGHTKRLSGGIQHMPATTDSGRGPILPQPVDDERPFLCARFQRSTHLFTASPNIEVLCAPMVVAVLVVRAAARTVLCPVASDFSADRGRTTFQNGCNSSKRKALR